MAGRQVIICPICKKKRKVTYVMAGYIRSQKYTGRCKSCASRGNKRRLGQIATAETRLKMSLAHLGKRNTPEHNQNISQSRAGVPTGRIPRSAFKKGQRRTKEEIRECLKRRPMSKLEVKVQRIIDKYGLPYKFVGNGDFFIERINPDFINTNGEKKAVEVYWRRHKEQFRGGGVEKWERDRKTILNKYGWQIIFIEGTALTESVVLSSLRGGK